jgi:hypothetical protein
MACNELGSRHGTELSGFHRELYRVTNEQAREDQIATLAERMAWDKKKQAQVRAHFTKHGLEWADYLMAVRPVYYSGATNLVQTQFKLTKD